MKININGITILGVAGVLLALWIVYINVVLDDPILAFVVGYSLSLVGLLGLLYAGLFATLSKVVAWLRPERHRRGRRESRVPSAARIHACLVFWVAATVLVNLALSHPKFHPLSLLADALLVVLTAVLAWTLSVPSAGKALLFVAGSGLFAIFVLIGQVRTPKSPPRPPDTRQPAALPYVAWVLEDSVPDASGVIYDDGRAYPGFNLYTPHPTCSAKLVDMAGTLVHEWTTDVHGCNSWNHVELCADGGLLVVIDVLGALMRLDWDSNIQWLDSQRFYHDDVEIRPNGEIYSLARKPDVIKVFGLPVPVLDDLIIVLSPERDVIREMSFFRLLGDRFTARSLLLPRYKWLLSPQNLKELHEKRYFLNHTPIDLFHINTLSVIERDFDDVFSEGNLLFCARTLSLIGVIDPAEEKVIWTWGPGELDWPHHPTLLDGGNLLIFDNGTHREQTRVIELNPRTGEIEWEYGTEHDQQFFSLHRGSSQRLPNGNTLIGDGQNSRAFEVTSEGEIVWEFYNPLRGEQDKRSTLYWMVRYYDLDEYPKLQELTSE